MRQREESPDMRTQNNSSVQFENRHFRHALNTMMILIMLGTAILMTSCGDKPFAGSWYDTSNPDKSCLVLSEDGKFSYQNAAGNYSVQDNMLILESTTDGINSDSMTVSSIDTGETCLVENDGTVWLKDYDKAVAYHQECVEEKISDQLTDMVGSYNTYDDGSGGDWLYLHEDGTYLYEYRGEKRDEGTWSTFIEGDYLKIAAESSINEDGFIDDFAVHDSLTGERYLGKHTNSGNYHFYKID